MKWGWLERWEGGEYEERVGVCVVQVFKTGFKLKSTPPKHTHTQTHIFFNPTLHERSVNGMKTDSCGVPASFSKNNTSVFESPRQIVKLWIDVTLGLLPPPVLAFSVFFLLVLSLPFFYFMVDGKNSG